MSGEEEDFWTATLEAFAPLQLKGPELTVKLLKRPPFRFIHDIVTSINAQFAAYDHILTPEQLDITKIDSKERKIDYLTTLINYLNRLLGKVIDVHVKKIIAGSEPEKTNVFLQSLALAVGLAQQDKARGAHSSAQDNSQRPAREAVESPPRGEPPSRSALPKRQSTSPARSNVQREELLRESTDFYNRMYRFSALGLDQGWPLTVKDEGRSIIKMYKELQEVEVKANPTEIPSYNFDEAIKRQINAIQEVIALQEENDSIIDKLESFLVP